jgi:hypothetical protein
MRKFGYIPSDFYRINLANGWIVALIVKEW